MVNRKPKEKPVKKVEKKIEKKLKEEVEEAEEEVEKIEPSSNELDELQQNHQIKASKSITQVKKGDKVKIDNLVLEVDSHYILIDHGTTKEMALELFDPKTDKDYQLRYFADQVETTLDFYELQEIIYIKRAFSKIEW